MVVWWIVFLHGISETDGGGRGERRLCGTRRQNPFGELLLLCAAGFISRSGRTKVGPVVVSPWWGEESHDGSMVGVKNCWQH